MSRCRRIFYTVLLLLFPLFFLLHWNGMFDLTYYWALVAVDGTRSFLPQLIFSFISAVILFGFIAAIFEIINRLIVEKPV